MGAHSLGELVVGGDLQRDGIGRRQILHAGRTQGQDLHIEAGLFHCGEPLAVQIRQTARGLALGGWFERQVLPLRLH